MLVQFIRSIHYLIIGAIGIAPFIRNEGYRKIICIFLIYLFIQYITGYERCGLTILEYMVLGKKYESGFLYRLINPMIKLPENYFNNSLVGIHLLYIYILSDSLV
jgi:hypothetical protein